MKSPALKTMYMKNHVPFNNTNVPSGKKTASNKCSVSVSASHNSSINRLRDAIANQQLTQSLEILEQLGWAGESALVAISTLGGAL